MPTPPMPLAQGHHTPAALSPGEAWEGRMSLAGSPTQRGRSGGRGAGALGGLEGRGSHGARSKTPCALPVLCGGR